MGYSLATSVQKEATNIMKISHRKEVLTGFHQELDHNFRQAFSHQFCGSLSLVNLNFLFVSIKKTYCNSLKLGLYFLLYNIQKKMCTWELNH